MHRFALAVPVLVASLGCGLSTVRCPSEGVELRFAVDGDASVAQALMTKRLQAAGQPCVTATATATGVAVQLADPAADSARLTALLTAPGHLRLAANGAPATYRALGEALSDAVPDDVSVRFDRDHLVVSATDRAQVVALVGAAPAGHRVAYEPADPGWSVWLLQDAGALDDPEVLDVSLGDDTFGPSLALRFGADDGARFADLTRAQLNQPLPLALDDELLMAPVVRSPIEGGRLTITLGPTITEAEAKRVSALIAGAGLPPTRLEAEGVY